MKVWILLWVLCSILAGSSSENEERYVNVDDTPMEEWDNPLEMGSSVHESLFRKMSNHNGRNVLLLRFIQSMQRLLDHSYLDPPPDSEHITWDLRFGLSKDKLDKLKDFHDLSDEENLESVENILFELLNNAESRKFYESSSSRWDFNPGAVISIIRDNSEDLFLTLLFALILFLFAGTFAGIISFYRFCFGLFALCSLWKWLLQRKMTQIQQDNEICEEPKWYHFSSSSCDPKVSATLKTSFSGAVSGAIGDFLSSPLPEFGRNLGQFFEFFKREVGFVGFLSGMGFIYMFPIIFILVFLFYVFGLGRSSREVITVNTNAVQAEKKNEEIEDLKDQIFILLNTIPALYENARPALAFDKNVRIQELQTELVNKLLIVRSQSEGSPCLMEKMKKNLKRKGDEEVIEDDDNIDNMSSNLLLSPPANFKSSPQILREEEEEFEIVE